MAELIACPHGISLPYSSMFNLNLRHQSKRPVQSRPSSYFWDRATRAPADDAERSHAALDRSLRASTVSLSDSEAEPTAEHAKPPKRYRKRLRIKLRKITFKVFTPKTDGTGQKNNVVSTTEIVSLQAKVKPSQHTGLKNSPEKGTVSIFRSWKLKSKPGGTQVKKMVAVVSHRISAASPPENIPKTWGEYNSLYANEQIDVHDPPLPPVEPAKDSETPTAFQSKCFFAPRPANEAVRQLVLNRMGLFGKKGFDPTEEGITQTQSRLQLGDRLMEQGETPSSLDLSWESRNFITSDGSHMDAVQSRVAQNPNAPPETLEQHPVFRRIVQQCRQIFQVPFSYLSVLDDDRQIFLAESGMDALSDLKVVREATRDISFCAHTILSGRKGFAVLDTHKDWRFQKSPLVEACAVRFYAGVPLMAPNLDGSQESEQKLCPLGTLCIMDIHPREFPPEDQKKLAYFSEYARREIEKWFSKKMEYKINALEASKETWNEQLSRIEFDSNPDIASMAGPKVLSEDSPHDPARSQGESATSGGIKSTSNARNPHQSPTELSFRLTEKSAPSLFEDINLALKPNMRKAFDVATKLVAETLDLSLVYLAASVPYKESTQLGRTIIISGHNIPTPVPTFDTALHLKALRTPEGGLLYQNPSLEASERDGLQPKSPTSEAGETVNSYASAMLLAVSLEPQPNGGGFILAGYTDNPKAVFGAEDVSYMKQFAQELSRYTAKLRL